VVAPIESSEGAVAALIAVAAGEALSPGSGVALGVIAVGVVLVARATRAVEGAEHDDPRAVPLALAAACSFGASVYATGRASLDLPIAWAVLPPRLLGVLFLTIPLGLLRRIRI